MSSHATRGDRRPLLKLLITVLFVLIIDRGLGIYLSVPEPARDPQADFPQRLAEFNRRNKPVDVLILGSSRARDAAPARLVEQRLRQAGVRADVANLAMSGGTFEAAQVLFDQHLRGRFVNPGPPKLVVYLYAVFEFNDNFFNRFISSWLLSPWDIVRRSATKGFGALERDVVIDKLHPLVRESGLYYLQQTVIPTLDARVFRPSGLTAHRTTGQPIRLLGETPGRGRPDESPLNQPDMTLHHFSVGGRQVKALRNLIEACRLQNIALLMVQAPVSNTIDSHYDGAIRATYSRIKQQLQNTYRLTFVEHPAAYYGFNAQSFHTPGHLNRQSAVRFVDTLVREQILARLQASDVPTQHQRGSR